VVRALQRLQGIAADFMQQVEAVAQEVSPRRTYVGIGGQRDVFNARVAQIVVRIGLQLRRTRGNEWARAQLSLANGSLQRFQKKTRPPLEGDLDSASVDDTDLIDVRCDLSHGGAQQVWQKARHDGSVERRAVVKRDVRPQLDDERSTIASSLP